MVNFKKYYKNGSFPITFIFGKVFWSFNLYAKWNSLMLFIHRNINKKHNYKNISMIIFFICIFITIMSSSVFNYVLVSNIFSILSVIFWILWFYFFNYKRNERQM